MKTLDAGQASLLASVGLSVVTLVKLTTYSDRTALTVQSTRYISDGARRYDWANTGTTQQFEPYLVRMEPGRDTMNHLPSFSGGGIESALRRRRTIVLRNWLPELGSYLFTALRAENLEHARVEIAQVFIDRGAGASFNDMSALVGTEQTWLFRGEVASIGRVDEQEIELECVAELPQIPWIYADVPATNDPKDLGARLPVVLGAAKHVRCVGWTVGWTTTLAAAAIAGSPTLEMTDASGLASSATNGARIGTSLISWTGKTANRLTGVSGLTNGQSAGQLVVEIITSGVWIVSGIRASAISNIYVADPFTGAFTRVTTPFSATLADTTTIVNKTVASVRVTGSQIQGMLDSLAQVGQKPAIVGVGSELRRAADDDGAVGGNGNAMRDGNLLTGDTNPTGTLMTWPLVNGRRVTEVTYEVYATLLITQHVSFDFPTAGTQVHAITNNSGATVTGWWNWTTDNPAWCGATMAFDCGVGSTIHQVQRTEKYTGGPTRRYETRIATSQVTSAHGSWGLTVDGDYTTGITTPAVQLGYRYTPVDGRLLVEVVHRAYLALQTADSWTLRTTSGGSDVFSADNGTGSTITGWFEYATTVPAEMGTDIYMTVTTGSTIYEVERVEIWEEAEGEVEIKSARVGLGLELFADVDGPRAEYDYAAGYSWDDTTGWTTATGTRTDEGTIKTEGSFSQKYIPTPASPTLLRDCNNDAANWASGDVTLSNEASITQAGGSLKIVTSAADAGGCQRFFASTQDFTSSVLRLGMFFAGQYFTASEEKVHVVLWYSGGSNRREWHLGASEVALNAWTTLLLDLATADVSVGGVTTFDTISILVNMANPQQIGSTLYVDEIYRVPGETCAVQRNTTTGTLNLVADGNGYKLDVRGDSVDEGTTLRVYFSNTAGSGTTKPATYWYFDIAAAELAHGAFVTIEKIASQFGVPASPTDVETVGFEVLGTKIGTFYVDNLRKRLATPTTPYTVAGGGLIEKIPDVIRYVLAELCGLGHSVIDPSFATVAGASYLDDNIHGLNLTALGERFSDVIAALTYEGRCSLVADERIASTIYRLSAALATYAWPASARTLTKWQELVEEGRDSEAIMTRTRFLYEWHPELGEALDAFAQAVQTTVTAAETKFGRHDADAVGLRTIQNANTAAEVAGYYAQELSRAAALWRISGVPWIDGYDLERADVVQFTPPWYGSAKKGRVIETTLRTDGLIDLRVVEVS